MKKILLLVALVAFAEMVDGQTNYARQYELLSSSKNKEMLYSLLDDWEQAEPQNVTMLVGQFNRHVNGVISKSVGLSDVPPTGATQYLALTDSLGTTTGYLYEYYVTNDSLLMVAIDYIDRAIAVAPDRADLRTGKIAAYWLAGDYYLNRYTAEIFALLDELSDKKRTWLYGDSNIISREEIVEMMQDYCAELFALSTDEGNAAVEEISNRILKIFPKNASAYSNLGSVASRRGKLKEAEKFYKKGLKLAPDDTIVLRNLTIVATKQSKSKDARKYLDRLKRVGSDDDRAWAEKFEKQQKL